MNTCFDFPSLSRDDSDLARLRRVIRRINSLFPLSEREVCEFGGWRTTVHDRKGPEGRSVTTRVVPFYRRQGVTLSSRFGKTAPMKLLVVRLLAARSPFIDYREIDPELLAAARRQYEEAMQLSRTRLFPLTGGGVHTFGMLHVEDDRVNQKEMGD